MNSKHLAKGSQCPPFGKDDEDIRIYSMKYCPYAQRALLVAHAKQIKFTLVNCDLTDKPEWLLARNPNGKVPVLELKKNGRILYESLVVAEYLDEAFPQKRPMANQDPFLKAWDKVLVEEFSKVESHFFSILSLLRKEDATIKDSLGQLKQALDPFEKELKSRGTPFFGGASSPGMLDYMIWPWFERMPVIKLFSKVSQGLDFEAMKKEAPLLEAWRKAMKEDSAVKALLLSPQAHKMFIEGHFAGRPDYDI